MNVDPEQYAAIQSNLKGAQEVISKLQVENAKLRADIAAKTEALKHVLEVSAEPERHGRFLTTADREIVKSALSPNPPVYVPGEIMKELCDAADEIMVHFNTVNDDTEWHQNSRIPGNKAETLESALALARPFITKGEK